MLGAPPRHDAHDEKSLSYFHATRERSLQWVVPG